MPKKATGASKTRRTTKAKKKTTTKRATKRAIKTATSAAKSGGKLRVRQVRSAIGHAGRFRRTLRALGLRHHQGEVVVVDNPSIRGMVHQVRHLVRVTAEEA